jgi:hypothetical protein
LVKKFIRNPAVIQNIKPLQQIKVTGSRGVTQKTRLIRTPNRSVPLNPQGSRNNPRAGNFATRQIRRKK